MDEILLKYTIDTSAFDKAADKIQDVTQLIQQQQQVVKATFSDASLSGAVRGFDNLNSSVDDLNDGLKQTGDALQATGSKSKMFDQLIQGAKGAASAIDLLNKATKSLGAGNSAQQALQQQITKGWEDTAKKAAGSIATIFNELANQQIQTLQIQYQRQEAALNQWHTRSLDMTGDNAQKKAAVERLYAAEQQKLQQQQATKEAEIKRQQAEIDKAIHLAQIIAQTAENVTKYTGGLPATAPLLAQAIITGALQAAVVTAQPLPQIPKFGKGGAVVIGNGKLNDGHLFGRSHRQGGILINAEGGEYIWDIPTVKKHGDLIKAAHENRIEQLVLHKYLLPVLENKNGKRNRGQEGGEDSFLLRASVNNGTRVARENAKYIVRGVSDAIKGTGYTNSRYH